MALDTKAFTRLKPLYQAAIVAGFGAAMLGAFWYWYLSPMQEQITVKEGQLSALQLEVAKSLLQKKMFEQFKADAVELGRELDALKAILPLERETDQILRSIYSQANGSGVRILRVNLRPQIDHEVYTEWPWDMEVTGTYNSISAFFDRIRRLPRIVNVANLKVSSRAAEGDLAFTSSVGSTFAATTFIYHEELIETSAPPPKPAK